MLKGDYIVLALKGHKQQHLAGSSLGEMLQEGTGAREVTLQRGNRKEGGEEEERDRQRCL